LADPEIVRRYTIKGWRVERAAVLDSTSEEAKRRAVAGDPGKLWIVADRQTAGRGRHGREWRSPAGNFYGSALLINPCAVADAPQLGFVAGLAARGAIEDLGGRGIGLKWPNDLVANSGKLAGILLEGWSLTSQRFVVSIGVGVNLAYHPRDLAYPATDLAALLGRRVGLREFLERLAVRFDERLAVFAGGAGFADIRSQWLACAAGLGQPLRATTANGAREGLFEGIDARGRLLLQTRNAIEAIESADIAFLGATASAAQPEKA
jgi:BirA family transcriptional regulator, biotin operon repressor / biotin---[acetyl-CoA-carboxylase] ligase